MGRTHKYVHCTSQVHTVINGGDQIKWGSFKDFEKIGNGGGGGSKINGGGNIQG